MRRLLLPLALLLVVLLAACNSAATTEPTMAPVATDAGTTTDATAAPTEMVEATAAATEVVEATAVATEVTTAPVEDKIMVICMAQEPKSLIWSESALVTSAVLEAVQPPLADTREYGYQATLVKKLPSIDDGDAMLEEVTIKEGDTFYDVASDAILTLTAGMTNTFSLNQLEGDPLEVSGYNGEELKTVQTTAQWELVDGLMWEDGEPVTADDSVFAFEVASQPEWTTSKYVIERTASYEAVDEMTLKWVGLPGYTDGTYFLNVWAPQARHVLGEMNAADIQADENVNRKPLSYGPYKVDEWIAGDSIMLSRNDNWVDGPAPLSELIYRFVPDTNQIIAQLVSGECDIGTQDAAFEGSLPLVKQFEDQGLLTIAEVAGTVFEHLDFNIMPIDSYSGAAGTLTDNEGGLLFQNVAFRQAIAHCIDRQAIIDQATNGAAFIQHTYTAADHPLYPGDDAITVYEFDPEMGKQMLADLGYTDTNGNGVIDKDGVELTFVHGTRDNPLRQKVTQIVQAQLAENCNVKTEIQLVGSDFFADGPDGPVFGRKYDMAEFAWLTGVEPPCNLYQTSQIPSEETSWGAQNNTGWSNEAFDTACNTGIQTLDAEEKATAHAEAMKLFTEELPSLPLFARAKIAVAGPNVIGLEMDPTSNSEMWNIENFDLDMGGR